MTGNGNLHGLAGYLGKDDTFDEAIVKYAAVYADQNEADFEVFKKMK